MKYILLLLCLLAACGEPLEVSPQITPPTPAAQSARAEASLPPAIAQNSETFIRIFKAESELELWSRAPVEAEYALAKTYPICSWSGALGPKLKEGDRQSPEGFYWVTKERLNPNSQFHLSFNIGYPNAYDRAHGRTGSFLMVHGNCVSWGCYAMTDRGIEEIYGVVEDSLDAGQSVVRVHVFPFRMTEANMARYSGSEWAAFWANLKEGYDAFEATNRPPETRVENKRYVFKAEAS